MTKIAKFQYKCRLCGAIEENPCTSPAHALAHLIHAIWEYSPSNSLLGLPKLSGNPVTMTSIHPCGDGNCGISDLIGYKVMKETP